MVKNHFILVCLTTILVGCNKKENENLFFNLNELNGRIIEKIGIDLNKQKVKTDSLASINEDYYSSIFRDMNELQTYDYLERAGVPIFNERDNGTLIMPSASDSLAKLLLLSLGESIILDNSVIKGDSIEFYKKKWVDFTNDFDPSQEILMYNYYFSALNDLNQNEFLSPEEYHYLLLYSHLLISLERMSERKSN